MSFELDEVLSLSDRIVVMANGRISASFEAAEADAARVARAAAPTQLEDAA